MQMIIKNFNFTLQREIIDFTLISLAKKKKKYLEVTAKNN